ncbi:E3 ubiquitin-protein ligase MIB2-like isoform X2 [Porites lutea]|uniref:E3 ubiquitin-protein ligase MIB2-like isoform X2 n=1 Tax=Porites lutea TaxID=51062 RepID=UPI003CC55693
MEVGSRVVRGPDWMWGDQDGGEGNVGTVVQHGQDRNLPDGTVLVVWDSGRQANYRAGHSEKFDLRILDCAQAGVKHTSVKCDGCKQSPLAGTRWKCADCPNYDLCSPCFMNDVHNMHHSFLRFDISGGDGIPVGKRSNFTKQQSRGLFPGARVTRGRDWKWGHQDGGGNVGQLTEITSWNGVERAGANVMWNLLSRNTYRTGHMGEVDLKCSSSAIGPPYYRECLAKFGENRRRLDSNRLRVGDRVSVCLDAEVLRAMSAGHGGWVDDMANCIGKVGKISKIDADGDVHVSYGLQSWVFHPQAITKALGKEGRILEVDSDGDAVVLVDSDLWLLNPAALEDISEGGEATSRRGDTSPTNPVDRATDLLRMLLLEAVSSKGGSVDPGDRLVNASSNGNLQEVREILEAHPGKIDHKRGGKTALHVACHQGRKEIVQYLLGKGADKDIKDEQDYSALHHAAYGDRSGETVTAMLNTGTNVNVSDNKNKSTPLHLAVNQGNDAGVRSLLASRHCDVNCQDLAGDTPLHDAISKEKNTIVELILRSERLEIFVCNGRGFNPLHQACMKGNLHAVQKIADKYPGLIEIPKEDGFTALHLAAFNNHLDIARCLLLSGHCDINLRNNKRQTALALSVSEAYTAMIELLVEHGADVNADDEDGDTPLHLAIIHQAVGTTGLRGLLQGLGLNLPAGAETDQHTGSAIAVYLVLHGANVSFYNHEGKTPLDLCQDTQTAALIQQFARTAPRQQSCSTRQSTFTQPRPQTVLSSSVPRPPMRRSTVPSSSMPPRPSTARSASGAAVQRQKKTQDTVNRAESAGTDCIICSENVATVTFNPCGHKVTCSVCSMKMKRCITCKTAIQQKTSPEGAPVSTSTLMDETDYAERIRRLESQLQAREDVIQCQICMERDIKMVFSCGHGTCKECSERLETCHICRQPIQNRIEFYN